MGERGGRGQLRVQPEHQVVHAVRIGVGMQREEALFLSDPARQRTQRALTLGQHIGRCIQRTLHDR
ncbi:hypothetical protein D3C81_2287990 [compost metagenome]